MTRYFCNSVQQFSMQKMKRLRSKKDSVVKRPKNWEKVNAWSCFLLCFWKASCEGKNFIWWYISTWIYTMNSQIYNMCASVNFRHICIFLSDFKTSRAIGIHGWSSRYWLRRKGLERGSTQSSRSRQKQKNTGQNRF